MQGDDAQLRHARAWQVQQIGQMAMAMADGDGPVNCTRCLLTFEATRATTTPTPTQMNQGGPEAASSRGGGWA